MKINQEKIYQYLSETLPQTASHQINASELGEQLSLSRSYASHLLNQLASDGKIIKMGDSRPVYYRLNTPLISKDHWLTFDHLPGKERIYRQAIQTAKAVLLYPNRQEYAMIVGERGSGKSTFANMMYEYALSKNIFKENSHFMKINCLNFLDHMDQLMNDLFRPEGVLDCFGDGLLFLDNAQYCPAGCLNQLFNLIETGQCRNLQPPYNLIKMKAFLIFGVDCSTPEKTMKIFEYRLPGIITLPHLEEFNDYERFEQIVLLLTREAQKIDMSFLIDIEALRSLILYHCSNEIISLRNDIRTACANAYVDHMDDGYPMVISYSHLNKQAKTGLQYFPEHNESLNSFLNENMDYMISPTGLQVTKSNIKYSKNRKKVLRFHKTNEIDIAYILSLYDQKEGQKYEKNNKNTARVHDGGSNDGMR